ncbi:heat shock transcription factor [Rhodotorula toruloides]|uniref:Heat shock transcription factor n=1 Tax=Rhodotorula toruloides TaxID=5286 RepID=A0A511K7N4_RHOTO|nr:heat shock transcription factor [Rhodotorula toruloides]
MYDQRATYDVADRPVAGPSSLLRTAPPARTITKYSSLLPTEAFAAPRAQSYYVPAQDVSYEAAPSCDCPNCCSGSAPRAYDQVQQQHLGYAAFYPASPSTSTPFSGPAYQTQLAPPFVEQPYYRPAPRNVEQYAYTYQSPQLPSPPIEDQLPHLGELPTYQPAWQPVQSRPGSSSIPTPPEGLKQYEQPHGQWAVAYSPATSQSPFLQTPVSVKSMDRRRSSGASSALAPGVTRRTSELSMNGLDSPFGSEYSFNGGEENVPSRYDRTVDSPTPFVTKLNHLLNTPEFAAVVRWSSDGQSILFAYDDPRFADALRKVFRHDKHMSFVRQLNIYDFKRLTPLDLHSAVQTSPHPDAPTNSSEYAAFTHPNFFRETNGVGPDLSSIKPKNSKKVLRQALASGSSTPTKTHNLRSSGRVGGGIGDRKFE